MWVAPAPLPAHAGQGVAVPGLLPELRRAGVRTRTDGGGGAGCARATVGSLEETDGAQGDEEQGPSGAAAPGTARGGGMEEAPMEWEGEEYGTADWEKRERARKGKGVDRGQDQ